MQIMLVYIYIYMFTCITVCCSLIYVKNKIVNRKSSVVVSKLFVKSFDIFSNVV